MKSNEIDVCCKYGFAVNLLITNIEDLIEDVSNGCDIEEVEDKLEFMQMAINRVRKKEKDFQKLLGIKED